MTEKTITEEGEYDLVNETKLSRLIVKSNNVVIKNLRMTFLGDKSIQLLGDNIVIRNSSFVGNDEGEQIIQIKGHYNRITECVFDEMNSKGCIIAIVLDKKLPSYTSIDNNTFRKCFQDNEEEENGWEIIRIGDSKTQKLEGKCVIYNNFFTQCQREIELISIKSKGNLIMDNTLFESTCITLRHSEDSIVKRNYFNMNKNEKCGGVRVVGKNNKICFNTFENSDNVENPFRYPLSVYCGENKARQNGYQPSLNTIITDNIFMNCKRAVALGVDNKRNNDNLPTGIYQNNHIYNVEKEFGDEKVIGNSMTINESEVMKEELLYQKLKPIEYNDIQNFYINNYNTDKDLTEEKVEEVEEEEEKLKEENKQETREEFKKCRKNRKERDLNKLKENIEDFLYRIEKLKEDSETNECKTCSEIKKNFEMYKKKTEKEIKSLKEEITIMEYMRTEMEKLLK